MRSPEYKIQAKVPGVSGNSRDSRDSREYKPQISRPFPSRGILNFPFPFPGKGSFGRELGREILSLFAVLNIF